MNGLPFLYYSYFNMNFKKIGKKLEDKSSTFSAIRTYVRSNLCPRLIEGELQLFLGKVVLMKVMIMANQAKAQFRSCVTAQV